MRLAFVSDAGHGWLAVPESGFPDVRTFGTGGGYWDPVNRVAYLEEDDEAPAFLAAHPDAGEDIVVYNVETYAKLRDFPHLAPAGGGA
jgi:hypothetical protein